MKPIYEQVFKQRVLDLLASRRGECLIEGDKRKVRYTFEDKDDRDILLDVTNLIQRVGVPAHIKGYKLIRRAILLLLEDPSYSDGITKRLYPKLAEEFSTSPACIERNIRHAVEIALNNGNLKEIEAVFGNTIEPSRGKPTNDAFLSTLTDHIMIQQRRRIL